MNDLPEWINKMREDHDRILKCHNRKVNEMAQRISQLINEGKKMKNEMERQLDEGKKMKKEMERQLDEAIKKWMIEKKK